MSSSDFNLLLAVVGNPMKFHDLVVCSRRYWFWNNYVTLWFQLVWSLKQLTLTLKALNWNLICFGQVPVAQSLHAPSAWVSIPAIPAEFSFNFRFSHLIGCPSKRSETIFSLIIVKFYSPSLPTYSLFGNSKFPTHWVEHVSIFKRGTNWTTHQYEALYIVEMYIISEL